MKLYYVGKINNCAACKALSNNKVFDNAVTILAKDYNLDIPLIKVYWEEHPRLAYEITQMMTTPVGVLIADDGVHHIIVNQEYLTAQELVKRILSALNLT